MIIPIILDEKTEGSDSNRADHKAARQVEDLGFKPRKSGFRASAFDHFAVSYLKQRNDHYSP